MSTVNDPAADAEELRKAARRLAHTTRAIEDPSAIDGVLGSMSSALASFSQSLHQLGQFHDGPTREQTWVHGDLQAGRAASYGESWELHRAAEMIHRVVECVDRAHEIESTISYSSDDRLTVASAPRPSHQTGLSL